MAPIGHSADGTLYDTVCLGRSRSEQNREAPECGQAHLSTEGGDDVEPRALRRECPECTKNATSASVGFTAEVHAEMKGRVAELPAEDKTGAKKADGLQAVLDSIAKMAPDDRTLFERVHVTATANAPAMSPKTWYRTPAYANADGKIVFCFKNAGKFNTR